MTTAETREQLKKAGLTDQQAVGIADVLERWQHDNAVTKDHLDARISDVRREISDAKADLISRLNGQTTLLVSLMFVQAGLVVGAVYYLFTHVPH